MANFVDSSFLNELQIIDESYQIIDAFKKPKINDVNIFRMMSYNVHGFTNKKLHNTYDKIIDNIKRINPDILLLQEVVLNIMKKQVVDINDFIKDLGKIGFTCVTFSTDKTNCIASKILFESAELDLGKDKFKYVSRNALIADFNTNKYNFTIVNTHLDVFDESGETRKRQINKIINHINNLDKGYYHQIIIGGDFNSLRKNDYTDDEWNDIVKIDKKRKVNTIEDVIPILQENKFIDSFVFSRTSPPKVTVWSNRRIDFIMGRYVAFCFSNVLKDNSSDHYPIYTDFIL